jgi:hypothetical protein
LRQEIRVRHQQLLKILEVEALQVWLQLVVVQVKPVVQEILMVDLAEVHKPQLFQMQSLGKEIAVVVETLVQMSGGLVAVVVPVLSVLMVRSLRVVQVDPVQYGFQISQQRLQLRWD